VLCDGRVVVRLEDFDRKGLAKPAVWKCPYCDGVQTLDVNGIVSEVRKLSSKSLVS